MQATQPNTYSPPRSRKFVLPNDAYMKQYAPAQYLNVYGGQNYLTSNDSTEYSSRVTTQAHANINVSTKQADGYTDRTPEQLKLVTEMKRVRRQQYIQAMQDNSMYQIGTEDRKRIRPEMMPVAGTKVYAQ